MLEKLSDMLLITNIMCLFIGIQLLIHGEIGFSASKRHAWFIIITATISLLGGIVSLLTRNT